MFQLLARTRRQFFLGLGLLALASAASAQGSQSVIKVVVPYPAGGITDAIARAVVERMSRTLGQAMIVENRPGAGSRIGTESVVRAPADGTSLLFTNTSYSILPVIDTGAKYDPAKSLAPVIIAGTYGLQVVIGSKLPVNSLQEFIAHARKNPGKLSYGSSGQGSGAHFAGEYFKALTATHMVHIPYRSTSGASADVAAGLIDLSFDASAKPYADAGKVKIIAVTGDQRDPRTPSVPTTTEAGLKDFVLNSWVGLLAPADTPLPVIERLNQVAHTALADPALRKLMNDMGVSPGGGEPALMAAAIQKDVALYRKIARDTKLKME